MEVLWSLVTRNFKMFRKIILQQLFKNLLLYIYKSYDDSASHKMSGSYSATPDDKVFKHLALVYAKSHKTMATSAKCNGENFPSVKQRNRHKYG